MPNDYLTTVEVADYLRLKERKVYDLVRQGHIPCSRATGKLLFPRQHIDMWVLSHLEGDQAQRQASFHRAAFPAARSSSASAAGRAQPHAGHRPGVPTASSAGSYAVSAIWLTS